MIHYSKLAPPVAVTKWRHIATPTRREQSVASFATITHGLPCPRRSQSDTNCLRIGLWQGHSLSSAPHRRHVAVAAWSWSARADSDVDSDQPIPLRLTLSFVHTVVWVADPGEIYQWQQNQAYFMLLYRLNARHMTLFLLPAPVITLIFGVVEQQNWLFVQKLFM